MTATKFTEWVQDYYHLPNRTAAVGMAAKMLRVREGTIWQWLSGSRSTSPSTLLLMTVIMTHDAARMTSHQDMDMIT